MYPGSKLSVPTKLRCWVCHLCQSTSQQHHMVFWLDVISERLEKTCLQNKHVMEVFLNVNGKLHEC